MKILVTGGAGFIGSHLVDKLIENNHKVLVLDDFSGGSISNINKQAKWENVDLRNIIQTRRVVNKFKPEIVFHLAANAAENKAQFSPIDITLRNWNTFINTLVPFINNGGRRFVFVSSIAVYGALQTPFKETDKPEPEDLYGVTKLACEKSLKIMSQVHGFEYVIARPHNVYGPRQNMCVEKDTLISTNRGAIPIKEVLPGDYVLDRLGNKKHVTAVLNMGQRKALEIRLKDQTSFIGGYENHRVWTKKRFGQTKWEFIKNLEVGDKIRMNYNLGLPQGNILDRRLGEILGLLVGDGMYARADNVMQLAIKSDGEDLEYTKSLLDTIEAIEKRYRRRKNKDIIWSTKKARNYFLSLGLNFIKTYDKKVPSAVWTTSNEMVSGFLSGLFSADGHITKQNGRDLFIGLSTSNLILAKQIIMLLHSLGIRVSIYTDNRIRTFTLSDGKIFKNKLPSHKLIIADKNSVDLFLNKVKFCYPSKQKKAVSLRSTYNRKGSRILEEWQEVISTKVTKAWLYDLVVDKHEYVGNQVVHHNSDPYRNVITIWMNAILRKKPWYIYGDGEQKRCFSYIDDVVESLYKCGFENVAGKTFNIGSDKIYTVRELSLAINPPYEPDFLDERPQEVKEAIADHTQCKRILGYHETPLEEGIKKTWEWVKSVGSVEPIYTPLEIDSPRVPWNWRLAGKKY